MVLISLTSRNFHSICIFVMAPIDAHTLFTYVTFNDAEELAAALKDESVDPNSTNSEGWSLLHVACKLGKLDCVKVLTCLSKTKVNIKGPGRVTPLFSAIESKQIECVQVLLAHKDLNVNICNSAQQTPLPYSILTGSVEVVKLLISHPGINLSAIDACGKTIYDVARELKLAYKKDILQLLGIERMENDKMTDEAHTVSIQTIEENETSNRITVLTEVLKAFISERDNDGMTILHRIACRGDFQQLKMFLSIPGIDVNIQSQEKLYIGSTPLEYAARYGHTQCVKLLLGMSGININAQDAKGCTPLFYAACNGHIECVNLLLSMPGINVNLQGS